MDDLEQLRLLGRGAMGSVHLMRRAADGAQFALKKIAIPTHEDREVALQEVRIMQRLRHAHIVHYLATFVRDELGPPACCADELPPLLCAVLEPSSASDESSRCTEMPPSSTQRFDTPYVFSDARKLLHVTPLRASLYWTVTLSCFVWRMGHMGRNEPARRA